jgi:hypothetical protein
MIAPKAVCVHKRFCEAFIDLAMQGARPFLGMPVLAPDEEFGLHF